MEYDPIMCMMVDKTTSVKTKDANTSKQGELGGIKYEILSYERATGKKASIRDSKYVLDKAIKMLDFDPIATLNNFKKTADIGDSTKIQLNNGKVAIVQKEVNGWYASIGNERVKGTFKIIEGFLKSQNDNY